MWLCGSRPRSCTCRAATAPTTWRSWAPARGPSWAWTTAGGGRRVRADRSYFGRTFVNDSFPAHGAVEWQWTLGGIVTTVVGAGLEVLHLGEYPEPFWRMGGVTAAAWDGRLPNAFSLLARRR